MYPVFDTAGMTKEAYAGRPLFRPMWKAIRSKLPTRGRVMQELIGSPRQFGREIMSGRAFAKGGWKLLVVRERRHIDAVL